MSEEQAERKSQSSLDFVEIGDVLMMIGMFLIVSSAMVISGIFTYGLFMMNPVFTVILIGIIIGACGIMWISRSVF